MTDAIFIDAEEELWVELGRPPTYEEVMDLLNSRYKGRENMNEQKPNTIIIEKKLDGWDVVDGIFKYQLIMGIFTLVALVIVAAWCYFPTACIGVLIAVSCTCLIVFIDSAIKFFRRLFK